MIKSRYSEILEEFRVPKSTIWLTLNVILPPLNCPSMKHLWDLIGVDKITKKIVREVIMLTVVKTRSGPKHYLLNDEESYIVVT